MTIKRGKTKNTMDYTLIYQYLKSRMTTPAEVELFEYIEKEFGRFPTVEFLNPSDIRIYFLDSNAPTTLIVEILSSKGQELYKKYEKIVDALSEKYQVWTTQPDSGKK